MDNIEYEDPEKAIAILKGLTPHFILKRTIGKLVFLLMDVTISFKVLNTDNLFLRFPR